MPRYLALLFIAALLTAQQPAPVFRAGTRLVEVTVTVLDKKGNAVAGLEPGDFTVLDEGKPRTISHFRFDGAATAPASAKTPALAPPHGVFTNGVATTGGETTRNITALVLDSLNTPPLQSTVARAQALRYLRTLAPETRVAIFVMGTQLRILHDFTDDAAALRARLEKATLGMPMAFVTDYTRSVLEAEAFVNIFAGSPAMEADAADMSKRMLDRESIANSQSRRFRMEQSIAALEALGRHLAGIPGRKNLVWIGSGFSMLSVSGTAGMGAHGNVEKFEDPVRRIAQRLAQQGVILYIVDSKGIEVPPDQVAASRTVLPPRNRGRFDAQMDSEAASSDPRAAMDLMASITGGRYVHNSNDLTAGFKQTVADLQGSYTLGFYVPGDPDDKWHKLKIRVNRSGISVRHREGYLGDPGPTQLGAWTDDDWRAAFSNPIASTVIPLTAEIERTPSGELSLALFAEIAAIHFRNAGENLTAQLEIAFGDRTAEGSTRTTRNNFTAIIPSAKWEATRNESVTYSRKWRPEPDVTSLRIVVHDAQSGQYGTLDIPLNRIPSKLP